MLVCGEVVNARVEWMGVVGLGVWDGNLGQQDWLVVGVVSRLRSAVRFCNQISIALCGAGLWNRATKSCEGREKIIFA